VNTFYYIFNYLIFERTEWSGVGDSVILLVLSIVVVAEDDAVVLAAVLFLFAIDMGVARNDQSQ
jgi:hypothetical protein